MREKTDVLILAVLITTGAALMSLGIDEPWRHYRDANGLLQERISRNYARQGTAALRFGPAFEVVEPELADALRIKHENSFFFFTRGNVSYLLHHPPALNLVLHAFGAVFGPGPAAFRLCMIFFAAATAVLLFLTVSRLFGAWPALAAVFFWMFSPIVLCFGRMLDYMPFSVFFFALGAWRCFEWEENRSGRNLALLAFSVFIGCVSTWYAYFLPPALLLNSLYKRDGGFRPLFTAVSSAAAAALGLLLIYYLGVVGADGFPEMLKALTVRGGGDLTINGEKIPIAPLSYLFLQANRIVFFFTLPAALLAAAALFRLPLRVPGGPKRGAEALIVTLVPGLLVLMVFRQGAYIHGFHVYLVSLFIAAAAGWSAVELLKGGWLSKVVAAAAAALFLVVSHSNFKTMAGYLDFSAARGFCDKIERETTPGSVVGQNIFDEALVSWFSGCTERLIMPADVSAGQMKRILESLPAGGKVVYYACGSLPAGGAARDGAAGYFYRNYERFDTVVAGMKCHEFRSDYPGRPPALSDSLGELPHVYYPAAGLIHVAKPPKEGFMGLSADVENLYIVKGAPGGDYDLLFRLAGTNAITAAAPASGILPTGEWRNEVLSDRVRVDFTGARVPPGEYELQTAFCSRREMVCLAPERADGEISDGGGEIPWTSLGRVRVGGTSAPPPPSAPAETNIHDVYAVRDAKRMREFARNLAFDPIFGMLASALYDESAHGARFDPAAMAAASDRFDQISLIEKLVPTAMQDFVSDRKFALAAYYKRSHNYPKMLGEYYGILLHVSGSYDFARRGFDFFIDKPACGPLAARYAKRMLYIRNCDEAVAGYIRAVSARAGKADLGLRVTQQD